MFATMTWILLTSMVIVGSAFVLIALERRIPYDSRQRLLRKGLIEDLVFYGLLQSYVLALVIATLIERMDGVTGLSGLQLVSSWPVWVQLLFFLVTHDLYIYGFHRLQHRVPLLWRLHEAHHATALHLRNRGMS